LEVNFTVWSEPEGSGGSGPNAITQVVVSAKPAHQSGYRSATLHGVQAGMDGSVKFSGLLPGLLRCCAERALSDAQFVLCAAVQYTIYANSTTAVGTGPGYESYFTLGASLFALARCCLLVAARRCAQSAVLLLRCPVSPLAAGTPGSVRMVFAALGSSATSANVWWTDELDNGSPVKYHSVTWTPNFGARVLNSTSWGLTVPNLTPGIAQISKFAAAARLSAHSRCPSACCLQA
jgi:hypothetical protein